MNILKFNVPNFQGTLEGTLSQNQGTLAQSIILENDMANRAVPLLTDRQAKLAKKTIAVGGVRGLILKVTQTSLGHFSRIFQLRMTVDGKARYLSIGPYPQVSLDEARKIALVWRNKVSKGENPRQEAIDERRKKMAAVEVKKTYSVQKMLLDFCEFGEGRLWKPSIIKGEKISRDHSDIVNGYIKNHIPKNILSMPAKHLTPEILAEAFCDKWIQMVDTPERILGEMKRAFDFAIRSGKVPPMANPADLKGRVRDLLPPPDSERVQKAHQPALPAERIPELFEELQKHPGVTSKLIQYTILTASRASNARLALWSEIFLDKNDHPEAPIQVTKRDEMKVKRVIKFDKETPLSVQAVKLLQSLPRFVVQEGLDFVFAKPDKVGAIEPVSDAACAMMLRKINADYRKQGKNPFVDPDLLNVNGEARNITLHGTARASFEAWAYDSVRFNHKQFSEKAIEHCLDHVTEKYNNAYLRKAVIGEMREILQAWADYCC